MMYMYSVSTYYNIPPPTCILIMMYTMKCTSSTNFQKVLFSHSPAVSCTCVSLCITALHAPPPEVIIVIQIDLHYN